MKAHYYDPMFYIVSEEMPFTIRIEVTLKAPVDGAALERAVNEAIQRYPYFAIQIQQDGEELLAVPNSRPIVVYPGPQQYPLGCAQVNRHMLALSFHNCEIDFYVSHVITDGGGFFPFIKTVLYEYLCRRHQTILNPAGIRMISTPFYPDELGNPFPERKMKAAKALYEVPSREYFRLCDGGYITDHRRTAFRFRIPEDELQHFNYDHDASPCSLLSSLMAKAVWSVHPDVSKDLVSAVSFNLRPGLENSYSYRMLCSSLRLHYSKRLQNAEIAKLCTCSRGMVSIQSQPENVLFLAERRKQMLEALAPLTLSEKMEQLGQRALYDAGNNTFSVSYVGKIDLGSLEPYLDSIYNFTDGSTYQSVFLEVSSVGGWFDIAFLQGFSSDVYYRAFLQQLDRCGLHYIEEPAEPLNTAQIELY